MNWVIETVGLRKNFGNREAVKGIDLRVPKGSFFGFLGPNGAGKTTTVHLIVGLLKATDGLVRVLGHAMPDEDGSVRRRIGVVTEMPLLFEHLSAYEYLRFCASVYGVENRVQETRIQKLLKVFELEAEADRLIYKYSKGMKKRLAMAAALVHGPELLILDEPFEGVDPVGARMMKAVLQEYVQRGRTVFLTSHVLELVERLCDHVAIIDAGRLLWQGPLHELLEHDQGLEDVFVRLVKPSAERQTLDWL